MARFKFFRGGSGRGGSKSQDETGTNGNDTLTASSTGQKVFGFGGNDRLQGGFGSDTLDGGDGNDTLIDDIFNASPTIRDTLLGGAGDDRIQSTGGRDIIDGGAGDDTISAAGDGAQIDGGSGNDSITTLGDDVSVDGGDGIDFASVSLSDATRDIAIDFQSGETTAFENGTVFQNVEAFGITTGSGDDTLDMTEFDDVANGGDGNDVLIGRGGDDALNGGSGDDRLDGGDGDDALSGGAGTDVINGGAGNDAVTLSGGDTVTGGEGADRFRVDITPSEDGIDVIRDFSIEEGDVLDFRSLNSSEIARFFNGDEIASGVVVLEDTADGVLISINTSGRAPDGTSFGTDVPSVLVEGVSAADLVAADAFIFDPFFG